MDEDKKPDHINIKVRGQDNSEVFFKIKKTTALRKLMEAYCDKQGMQLSALRFLFDGKQIFHNDTPENVRFLLILARPCK
jgi:small ubiquitin-related modifier